MKTIIEDIFKENKKWSIKRFLAVIFSFYIIRVVETILSKDEVSEGSAYILFIVVGFVSALLTLTVANKHFAFNKNETVEEDEVYR